jgi:hypothetical protein
MRTSEFTVAVVSEFGEAYAPVVTKDVVLHELGDRTAEQALRDGVAPKDVWLALCEAQGVPETRRHGVGLPRPRR